MTKATEFTQQEVIEKDRDEQFEDMYYKLTCERCGEEVLGTVLAKDFDGSIIRLASVFDKVIAHNMTHYVPLNTE